MTSEQYSSDIERFIEQGADSDRPALQHDSRQWDSSDDAAELADGVTRYLSRQDEMQQTLARAAEQESDDDTPHDDSADALAQVYARAHAAQRDSDAASDDRVTRDLERIQEVGYCGCNDGTHYDKRGVLEVALELGSPYDFDRAAKVWHSRVFGWEARSKARTETDPKIDKQNAYEKARAIEDINALKQKYLVKREPHKGRIEDDPQLDTILGRALGPVRGNALPHD